MWVATTVAVVGLLGVAVITQFTGYRLGGTITVPVLAVYSLKNFLMLPVFVLSTITAYLGLWYLRQRTLIYGRDELLAAIVIGTAVPLITFLFMLELGLDVDVIVFIGSILPGLAAYNYHRIKPEYRRNDLLAGIGLLGGLTALGWVLVTPGSAARFGALTPPVLFAATADVAVYKGAVVDITTDPVIVPRVVAAGLFVAGLLIAERIRGRFDVRIGVITAVLMAIYALASYWLVVMYLVLFLLAFVFTQVTNYATLRYGRVLLGVTTAVSLLVGLPLAGWLPTSRGLSAFFVAILAGVTAYNAHATAPFERRLVLPLQAVVFVPALIVVRLFGTPGPQGIPQELTAPVILVCVVVVLLGLGLAHRYTVTQPDRSEVLSASVLSGEGNS